MRKFLLFCLWLSGVAGAQPAGKWITFDVYPPDAVVYAGYQEKPFVANTKVWFDVTGNFDLVVRAPGWAEYRQGINHQLLHEHWPTDGPLRLKPASFKAHLMVVPRWPLLFLVAIPLTFWWARRRVRHRPAPRMETTGRTTAVAGMPWDLPPGIMVGNYKVWDKLGEGASGVVYRVENDSEEEFALKLLKPQQIQSPELLERFRREMGTLRKLNHPNIPYLADLGEFNGMSYLVMELLGPETLQDRLRKGPLPPPEAVKVLRQLADALYFCHKQGILHRDVKPENVIWGEGRVRLSDFGLARHADAATLTQEGTIMGTPCYMAPEIVQGEGTSTQTDQYSLGCVAYHLVAGAPPFQAENPMVVLMHHIEKNPPPLTHVPQPLTEIIFTMLRKRPEHRFRSLEVLIQKLDKLGL